MMSESGVVSGDLAMRVMSGSLPQVLHCILSHLSVADVCRVSSVCSTWNQLANDNQLWWALGHRDQICFQDGTLVQEELDKRCEYKSVYKQYSLTLKKWMTGEGVGVLRKALLTPNGEVFKGACLAVGSHYILAWLETDHNIHVFSAVTGEYSHQLEGLNNTEWSNRIIVSKDETMAVGMSYSLFADAHVVFVWQIDTGECLHSLEHPDCISLNLLALHKTMLAVGVGSADVFMWNIESGQLLRHLCCTNPHAVVMDDHHIVIHDWSVVQLWDVNTWTLCFTMMDTGHYEQLLLDGQTHSLVGLGGLSSEVSIWDTETGVRRGAIPITAPNDSFRDVMIHDGTLIIAIWGGMVIGQGPLSFSQVVDLRAAPSLVVQSLMQPALIVGYACHRLYAVCKQLIVIAALWRDHRMVSVWHMKQRQFVRRVDMDGNSGGAIVDMHVSFNKLRLVLSPPPRNNALTFVTYDFSS